MERLIRWHNSSNRVGQLEIIYPFKVTKDYVGEHSDQRILGDHGRPWATKPFATTAEAQALPLFFFGRRTVSASRDADAQAPIETKDVFIYMLAR